MWLVRHYEMIHRVAWYLGVTVSVVVLLFLVVAIAVRVWRDRMEERHRRLFRRWKQRFAAGLKGCDGDGSPSDRELVDVSFVEQRVAMRAWLDLLDGSSPGELTNLLRRARDVGLAGVARGHLSGTLEDQLLSCRVLGYVHDASRDDFSEATREKLES